MLQIRYERWIVPVSKPIDNSSTELNGRGKVSYAQCGKVTDSRLLLFMLLSRGRFKA